MIRPLLVATLLLGCTVPVKLPDGKCRAEGAIGYVGQRYNQRIGRIVKDKTQATRVRTIPHDVGVTQEYRASRVNIVLDERNVIKRIYCG